MWRKVINILWDDPLFIFNRSVAPRESLPTQSKLYKNDGNGNSPNTSRSLGGVESYLCFICFLSFSEVLYNKLVYILSFCLQ